MDLPAILDRFLERPRIAHLRAVLDTYGRAPGGLLANGLAFATLFATIPVALVTLGLAGFLVDDPRIQARLARALVDVFPPLRDLISGSLDALTTGAPLASIIGLVGVFWTVSQVYVMLDAAFARIFSEVPERDGLRRTARGFLWVGSLLTLVIVAILVGSFVALADASLPNGLGVGAAIATILTSVPALFIVAAVTVAGAYRTLPTRSPSWAAIGLPAVIVGVAVVGLAQAFALLVPWLVGVAAVAGALATVFIALTWLSFTFQALLYGAAWVRVRDDQARAASESALRGAATATEPSGRRE
ncbi:MAG: YihY/virulence factor BrkB family protein [Candidatus Limnocylindrales bacterium]